MPPARRVRALDRLADKWTVLVVGLLDERPHRFGELLRQIDGISQKMLTQTLRSLEQDGLIDRRVKPTVPVTVEYSLTPTGRTLTEPLAAIRRWAELHIESVLASRARQGRSAKARKRERPTPTPKGFNRARHRYAEVSAPVTLVYCDRDWSRPAERDQVAGSLADVQRITLARTGHFSSLERPDNVAQILLCAVST